MPTKERKGHRLVVVCWVCEQVMWMGSMEPIFIVDELGSWSLFVRVVVSLVDDSWLIDNSRELRDNVRDNYLNYR